MKFEEIIKDPTWVRDIKAGVIDESGLSNYLIRTVPVSQIARLCASYIFKDVNGGSKPIVITEAAFQAHFRIQGYRWDNGQLVKENRGNYSDGRNKG